ASLSRLSPPAKASRLVMFGHIAEIRGNEALARDLFFEAAATDSKYAQQAGEVEAAAGNWDKAAVHFGAAASVNPSNRLAHYLWGDALRRVGDADAGDKLVRQVNVELLAPTARYDVIKLLVQRWLKDDLL